MATANIVLGKQETKGSVEPLTAVAQAAAAAAAAAGYDIHDDVGEVLFTKDAMASRTIELGREIGSAYAGKRPLLMPILKGS